MQTGISVNCKVHPPIDFYVKDVLSGFSDLNVCVHLPASVLVSAVALLPRDSVKTKVQYNMLLDTTETDFWVRRVLHACVKKREASENERACGRVCVRVFVQALIGASYKGTKAATKKYGRVTVRDRILRGCMHIFGYLFGLTAKLLLRCADDLMVDLRFCS